MEPTKINTPDNGTPPDQGDLVTTTAEGAQGPISMEALMAGDEKAFEQLVVQESPRLFRVIVRIIGDDDEAESILQETFLQAYQRIHTFRRESKLTTWLYAIGINLARASLRKSRRLSSLEDQEVERMQPAFNRGMFVETPAVWDPSRVTELSDRQQLVRRGIGQLPEDYKTVIILRDIEEYSTEEVAKMLDISSGAVRVRLHRARGALRKLLDPHMRRMPSA
ncbi:MAG: sigma-70 family RNA polymerase sigma factor [Bacteroidota bacterium]|nr:sigma-70 family RNA polymerase sigma factor [Bacteroidota bacterium]